ncbi:MAG TPA: spermidine synthase [Polyangiaceae bacterium]
MARTARTPVTPFTALVVLYFASGAVGLVDEVIFFKYLSLAFGATAHASSAVLVAFMGGLALGAMAAARFDARVSRPLLVYGALEIGVGLLCAASPWLFGGVAHLYVAMATGATSLATLEIVRTGLAAAVVLLPTVAMGATLPLVARVAAATAGEGGAAGGARRVATLYGANTAGGAVGALLGAYAVIPALGLATSLRAGALVSVGIGVTAMLLSRRVPVKARATAAPASDGAPRSAPPLATREAVPRGIFVAAAASGLLVFAGEVVFIHLLALVDGTSVYVFGLVLAVFLVALSAGAAASRVLARRAGASALAASLALSGLVLAASLPVWDRLPDLFVAAGPLVPAWWEREVVRGLVAALAIGLPAACMGMTFPLVLAALSSRADRGARIGVATAVNTVASMAGSLLAGFVLLPALGSQRACGAIALAYAATALLVPGPGKHWIGGLAAAVGLLVVAVPRWDLARLSSGANVYFERQPEQGKVVWIDEDLHGGVVTVTRRADITTLWTNGKYQGDTGWQMTPQRSFADVPAMFVPRFGRALVVGVGTGVTVQQTARYPFERVDVAELSPGIVKAARTFFAGINGGVLDEPRVHVRLEDGRNLLVVEKDRYDLVTVELTSIWFSGAANLYNKEFYEVAATKLTEGGVLSQWIQLHHTTVREIASQMATARAVFPHAAFFVRGQGVLVLGTEPLRARDGADLSDLVLADETMDAFIDETCRAGGFTRESLISTDDNLRLEYATPRNNVPSAAGVLDALQSQRSPEVAARLRAR